MKIVIYACVYNSERTLAHTIESVLQQSYKDFEFHIEDNGSVDGTRAIIYDYASRDSRVVPHIRDVNHTMNGTPPPIFFFTPPDSTYFTSIDGDDWWERDYLERLLDFAEHFRLDIACTGTLMHDMATGGQGARSVACPLILEKRQFAETFPYYHAFFRPIWGKMVRTDLIPQVRLPEGDSVYCYGGDTVYSFQLLRHADRIGIHDSVLHHYRIDRRSVSGQYNPKRFESDIYLYNDAIDFLSSFGPVSAQNHNFLQCVYSNAIIDTTGVIQNSSLSPADKLREYRTIAINPITLTAYRECTDESAARSKMELLVQALKAGAALGNQNDSNLRAVMLTLLPHCGQAISAVNAGLFLKDRSLLQALLNDDADAVLDDLLERLRNNQGGRKYALPETIRALAINVPLLCQLGDSVFLRKYGDIYQKIWRGERLAALDDMAGLLIEGRVDGGKESFLTLFISLAALEEQVPAFIFGKLQLGKLYLRQKRFTECRTVVMELEEMGVTDSEELNKIRKGCEHS